MSIIEGLREAAEIQKLLPTLDFTVQERLADIGRLLTTDAPPLKALANLVEADLWERECRLLLQQYDLVFRHPNDTIIHRAYYEILGNVEAARVARVAALDALEAPDEA